MKLIFFMALTALSATGIVRGANIDTPSFMLHRGDASAVSVELLGSTSSENARLSFLLKTQKAKEFSKFVRHNDGAGFVLIVTDFENGSHFTAYTCVPSKTSRGYTASLVYHDANSALNDGRALLNTD